MNVDTNGIELEDEVRDRITGYKGKATAIAKFVTGCARVMIQPLVDKDGKLPEPQWFDVLTTEVTKAGPAAETAKSQAKARTGGPQRGEPRAWR
jgi:hypothetical protein